MANWSDIDLEKLTKLVEQLGVLVEKFDPEITILVIYLFYGIVTFYAIKTFLVLYSERSDKRLIRDNERTMGKVTNALDKVIDTIQNCRHNNR